MSQENSNPYETGLDKNAANYVPLSPIGFLLRSAAVYPNRIAVIHGEHRYTTICSCCVRRDENTARMPLL